MVFFEVLEFLVNDEVNIVLLIREIVQVVDYCLVICVGVIFWLEFVVLFVVLLSEVLLKCWKRCGFFWVIQVDGVYFLVKCEFVFDSLGSWIDC